MLSTSVIILCLAALGWASPATMEKREMPNQAAYSSGGYGGGGYDQGAVASYQQAPPVPAPAPYPPFGFKDPGFSVQTGFEGFLVPNSWHGLLPWGIEGVVIVIVAVIVFVVIIVAIIVLLAWLCGFGDYAIVKEQARNFLPAHMNLETLSDVTNSVFDALQKYNELYDTKKIA